VLRILAVILAALLVRASPAAGEQWRWPVRGAVASPFRMGADPYAAGQHRGIDILARPGTGVRTACTGRVRFAGTVARSGGTVSVECGALTATYLHLGALAVRAGAGVRAGDRLGYVARGVPPDGVRAPHVHFGVRRTARRFGYLDPLRLLPRLDPSARRPVVLPARRAPRGVPPGIGPPAQGAPAPRSVRAPAAGGAPRAVRAPALLPGERPAGGPAAGRAAARVGLVLVGLAVPGLGGTLVARRRRRVRLAAPAAAQRARA
jgi:hypothetical protein